MLCRRIVDLLRQGACSVVSDLVVRPTTKT
jgi:hypothetical protein